MQQLHASDRPLLGHLFSDIPANAPMLRAFLEGRVPGHAFVDALPKPGAAAVAVNYRFVFFGGAVSPAFQEQVVRQLRYQQAIEIVWPGGTVRLPHGSKPEQVVPRLEFIHRCSGAAGHLDTLAGGALQTEVKRIDSRNIAQCLWRDDVLRAIGSTSEFLGHGLGFCLMVDETIVAEAYAVIWSGDRAEIATVTHPRHRGRGYATVLCASLIKACEAVDLKTYWNCDVGNQSSLRLATRLGYTDPQEYRLIRYSLEAPVSKFVPKKRPGRLGRFARQLFGRTKPGR